MTAYLFLLATFAAAWAVVGFSAAMLFLKMRWNLVGGFCLVVFGWLPVVIGIAVCGVAVVTGTFPTDLFTIEGMLDQGVFAYDAVRHLGYCLGVVAGTLIGFYPRTNEDGKRERRARSWPLWKTLALAPVPLALAWGLFWLADLRAKDRLLDLRDQYQDYLALQEDAAPDRSHDASSIHESIYIALMQDPLPEEIHFQLQTLPTLQMLLSDSEHLPEIREYCQRHAHLYDELHEVVEQNRLKHHRWHRTVQRLVVLNGALKIADGELPAAEEDLRLLRHMGQQCLDEHRGDLFEFFSTEDLRGFLFQLMHASGQRIPISIYDEMRTREDDWRWKVGRSLKRYVAQEVSEKVDNWLAEPEEYRFSVFWRTAATRIVQQEHYLRVLARLEHDMLQFFLAREQRFTRFANSPFAAMDPNELPWGLSPAVDSSCDLAIRDEVLAVATAAEQERDSNGAYPRVETVQAHLHRKHWGPDSPLRYQTFHDRDSGEFLLAIVHHPDHLWMGDGLALYLGPQVPGFFSQRYGRSAYRMTATGKPRLWFELATQPSEGDSIKPSIDASTTDKIPDEPPNP